MNEGVCSKALNVKERERFHPNSALTLVAGVQFKNDATSYTNI
jgi:hypothetical protein